MDYVKSVRSRYDEFEGQGKELCGQDQYREERCRKRPRNSRNDDGDSPDTILSPRDKFKTDCFYAIVDKLSIELMTRTTAYSCLRDRFGFLSLLDQLSDTEIRAAAINLVTCYPCDLEDVLPDETIQFSAYARPQLLK